MSSETFVSCHVITRRHFPENLDLRLFMLSELERIEEAAVVTCFRVLSRNLSGVSEEDCENRH
jgi:hypothetical protein